MAGTRWVLMAAAVALCLAASAQALQADGSAGARDSDSHMRILERWSSKGRSGRRGAIDTADSDDDGLLTVLVFLVAICGTVVGIGFVVTMIFACVQIFKGVRRRLFGLDEYGVSERMRSQMLLDDDSRQSYELALAFERQYPYGSVDTQITPEQQSLVREKGVEAWEFVVNIDVNAMLQSKTEVLFMGGENCVQTNLPLPKANSVYYFEVKLIEKPTDVNMWIGLATKPYPAWRMAGWNKYSTGYCVNNGIVHQNSPFKGVRVGERLFVGDILGIGYQPRSGVVWFTRNGRRFKAIVSGMLYDLFPTISADGPCSFSANFGQRGFVFVEANVKRWGFGPVEGAMLPPPIYGANQNTILLETALASSGEESDNDTSNEDGSEASELAADASIRGTRIRRAESPTAAETESAAPTTAGGGDILEESTVINIDDHSSTAPVPVAGPRSIRRAGGRRPLNVHKPPQYQKEDPIAMQLLEAGSTSLEPVVSYRNKSPELLEPLDPDAAQNASSSSSASSY
ncbi:Protein ssh4 [Coemansia sp. RSA 1939]|nr:Protein ssh4 [Coemansia sp. RSA 1939]KAJ2615386.1 Protein ssh4 [Coemansia sp. RSA 1804]